MKDKRMQIIYRSVSELIPYVNNPRKNDPAVDAVAASISEFGFKVPIILDGNDEIIAGHTRLKAAKKFGYDEVPTILADDLSPEQVRAFRLADNKVAEFAEWDDSILSIELDALTEMDFDMGQFGFDYTEDEYPDELDAETDEIYKTVVKFTFDDFKMYSRAEERMKKFADEVGAKMTVSGT